MEWGDILGEVNYVAVLAATASSFVIGMIWYAEGVFGKQWMKLVGLKKKDMEDKNSMMRAMLHSGVASFIGASVLAALLVGTGTDGWSESATFGAVIGLGIAMTSAVTHDVFARVNMTLTRINGLHDIVKWAAWGAIIGGIGAV